MSLVKAGVHPISPSARRIFSVAAPERAFGSREKAAGLSVRSAEAVIAARGRLEPIAAQNGVTVRRDGLVKETG